jgi:Uma2 family endonuclease
MQIQTASHYYTPEEYLALEEKAEYKSEYHNGEIIPMTGGTTNHNEISLNLATNLKFYLKKQPYKVYMSDVRLWIPSHNLYTYPDVMVIKNEPVYTDKSKTTITNPILIAEVLSKSTQNYDLGEKFTYYRTINSFVEYLLISQHSFHVMQYSRTEKNQWLLSEYVTEDAVIKLNSLNLEIELVELYNGSTFTAED